MNEFQERLSKNAEEFDTIVSEMTQAMRKLELTNKELHTENESIKFDNRQLREVHGEGVWVWHPEEENHLESLSCPILIMPEDLRRLLNVEEEPKEPELYIPIRCQFSEEAIQEIEEKYNARYVIDTQLVDAGGQLHNMPISIFWTDEKHPKGSNYMGIYKRDGHVFITDGLPSAKKLITAIIAEDGEVVWSTFRHDFATSKDGTVSADGGLDYGRFLWKNGDEPKLVGLRIVNDSVMIVAVDQEES